MTDLRFRVVLKRCVISLLARLAKEGYWDHASGTLDRRYDPTTWDINNGYCEEFANLVMESIGNDPVKDEIHCVWMDELTDLGEFADDPPSHYVIVFRGKYYDAEETNGVENWRDLSIIKNRDKTRTDVLKERGEEEFTEAKHEIYS